MLCSSASRACASSARRVAGARELAEEVDLVGEVGARACRSVRAGPPMPFDDAAHARDAGADAQLRRAIGVGRCERARAPARAAPRRPGCCALLASARAIRPSSTGSPNAFHHSPRGCVSRGRGGGPAAVAFLERAGAAGSAAGSMAGERRAAGEDERGNAGVARSVFMSPQSEDPAKASTCGTSPCCLSCRLPAELAQQHVEHRREEEAERGDADHSGEHRDAHRLAHLGAGAGGEGERHDAHHERHRRHQDRTQPQAARLDRGVHRRRARRTPARARIPRSGSRSSPRAPRAPSGRSA